MDPILATYEQVPRDVSAYSLDPLRTLLDDAYVAGRAMRDFSVQPYLQLCGMAYDPPDIRSTKLSKSRFDFNVVIQNDAKRFAVMSSVIPHTLIIVFRGTVTSDTADLRSDLPLFVGESRAGPFANDARVVHELNEAGSLGRGYLQEERRAGRRTSRVVLTGHSLGGRIAYEVSKANPEFDVITFNMGSNANRVIRDENTSGQQRTGIGLHVKVWGDVLSGNIGDDGSDRNIVVEVRLADPPKSKWFGSFQHKFNLTRFHGWEYMLAHCGLVDKAVKRRLGLLQGGRHKLRIKAKSTRKGLKSRKCSRSRCKKSLKVPRSRKKPRKSRKLRKSRRSYRK